MKKTDVIILGAGPAGLSSAYKLTEEKKNVIIFEKDSQVGGICKTIKFNDFYFDLGGHRFFTKSQEVKKIWDDVLGNNFLERPRLSRIYYKKKFFYYPIKPFDAFLKLGLPETIKILFSYLYSRILPYKKEKTFEHWISNRFGKKLYSIFFKTYTEKIWGIPCSEISAEWSAQRIKGLSLVSTLKNSILKPKNNKIKTLITTFKYPKYGPGMMYEEMEKKIINKGNKTEKGSSVIEIFHNNSRINRVIIQDRDGNRKEYSSDYFISSIPITEFVKKMNPSVPKNVVEAADALSYRSFISVSVILDSPQIFPDNWIYIHSPEVRMGRIQNFKNWSPFMVPDTNKTSLGLEYFCSENDDFWNMKDTDIIKLGMKELEKIGLSKQSAFIDGFVSRVPKAYPVYNNNYFKSLTIIKDYLSRFNNLQTIGRYGMFKYNNMDHSMLTGIYAAENIMGADHDIWKINCDDEYHEEEKY